ncbi:hypothetical protein DPQ33_13720 [Oceanidesulfovibrio indonesiensis]|uniref:DUF5348 domain-containing protein n=1 Tax=Oceanidesulfovibrio indonesiensis TaxID=54767 RepID=A0A7M3MCE1_9BACT|nr:hypothetical protein [Oceanidesulfovibrio indonesiensis]TVM16016.1 hypothetical protein DPQ33_13720 [Oceanidesulfovibrio indonesiensis]
MEYTEANIPVEIKHGEYLNFEDGSYLYWESNGEAKNVFLGSGFEPDTEIFPGNSWEFSKSGKQFRLTAKFEDALLVEKL